MKNISDFSTYQTGILQARAYRNLRFFMEKTLDKHGLTSTEWSMLGVISDETKNGGIRVSDLARLLDVNTSFITNTLKRLQKLEYVTHAYNEDDARVRLVIGTDKGHLKVFEIERYLRKEMREWMSDINHQDLVKYIQVLSLISRKTDS